ncbi:uncharacterized protein LOC106447979 [Brassica napus]|uniref:uncharacterized protein LOC106447979 n=1 Tax=Brassica napus TaxID=3708 RepID=UPI0020791835|nr:uncharacterized protein LOC106447979 [Brassica napus]
MVSCRLVDLPEDDVTDAVPPIPDMMFAAGEEPVGVRVLTYQSSRAINHILNSLEEDEIQTLRKSPFGKIVDIAEKPGFSGRFTRYILSRQLKVEKKHEAWFRFAGKPIRFSLREFAIVTGLNCGEYPKSSVVRSKKNKNVKPYWPELFGKSEDLRVSTALKMLRRKTVTEKEVRIKLACLAIVSSVLLATNLKMKMIKEHAEAMVDLEEFYSFPWGRLAFEMLMGSIKQRDEVSLSQNTIAVKGFALALQLVMVEAVPDLTAVVLETCSSSESDSCDDDDDFTHKKTKKKTLSPGHAREIDKKTNVIVRSIIPEDPDRPLIPANLVWADEAQSHPFTAEMFKGGATKLDVERMRELGRAGGKQKRKTKTQTNTETVEDKRIAAIVLSMLKPEVQRVEANVAKAVSMAENTASKFASFDTTVMVSIQNLLNNFKDEVIRSVMQIHNSANAPTQPTQPDVDTTNHVQRKVDIVHPHPDPNDAIIAQVIGSLSQYSTPPRNASVCPGSDGRTCPAASRLPFVLQTQNSPGQDTTLSANSHTKEATKESEVVRNLDAHPSQASNLFHGKTGEIFHETSLQPVGCQTDGQYLDRPTVSVTGQTNNASKTADGGLSFGIRNIQEPSFSLGLTQPENPPLSGPACDLIFDTVADHGNEHVDEHTYDVPSPDPFAPLLCRKSKRPKIVPADLVKDYHCGADILSRARAAQPPFCDYSDPAVVIVINIAGLAVTSKDITGIVELTRSLPARVVDILVRFVRATCNMQQHSSLGRIPEFLDTRYVALLFKHFPKFSRSKTPDAYPFPKGLFELLRKDNPTGAAVTHYYFPFDLGNKQWVGVCFDCTAWKLTVLDCNISIRSDSQIATQLRPFAEMIPYLLKHTGRISNTTAYHGVVIERPKVVAQNTNPSHSALTSILLMQTHAIFGLESCRCITPTLLTEEAHRVAVMLYELHEKL